MTCSGAPFHSNLRRGRRAVPKLETDTAEPGEHSSRAAFHTLNWLGAAKRPLFSWDHSGQRSVRAIHVLTIARSRAAVPPLKCDEALQRLHECVECHGCLDTDVSPIGSGKLTMEPLFSLGSGLKRNDDRAHGSPSMPASPLRLRFCETDSPGSGIAPMRNPETRYRSFLGQERTIRAITTQPTRAAAIPTPITQPRVADSGKGDIAASNDCPPQHRLEQFGVARSQMF